MEQTPLAGQDSGYGLRVSTKRNRESGAGSLLAVLAIYSALTVPAFAGVSVSVGLTPTPAFPKTNLKSKTKPSSKEPVMLTAEHVDYDKDKQLVIATGKVEIVQGDTIMLADKVTYQQQENIMTAEGNISILESSGNVVFADSLELKDDLKAGVVKGFKARLSDNSLMVANSAKKHDENITELHQAVYSPCKACRTKEGDTSPLWQIHADHVLIDREKQEITYDDAQMQIYGVPIFYTPYFSHPTPGADNQSGLLEPTLKQSTNLGTVYKQPIYYSIAPDKDVTLTPIYTTLEGPVMAGEYRQMFNDGNMSFAGSITKPQTRDSGGPVSKGQQWRGHLDAIGYFNYDPNTDWGFNVRRTSDDTYLRRYDFSNDTLLTSRLYVEKHDFIGDSSPENKMRSFASIQALKFDGLTAADNAKTAPVILPLADFNWESAPGYSNSRFTFDSNVMSLTREQGSESRRLSNTAGWKLPYITADGQIIEFATQLRADIYSVNDQPLANGQNYNGQTGRIVPQASVTWRYPVMKTWEQGNLLLEPIVMVAASPNSSNSNKIPNEDSQVPEFNASNLFSPNRFAGYDRVETGAQASYGLRGQAQLFDDKYIDWLVGQHYRQNTNNNFPYSNNSNSNLSDYVGKLDLYYDPVVISYRTRLDKDSLAFNQNEVYGTVNYYPVSMSVNYLSLKHDQNLQDKEEITGAFGVNLTREWNVGVGATRDLQLGRLSSTITNLTFKNECIFITNSFGRNYTYDRDIKPAMTYMFHISFKNLD